MLRRVCVRVFVSICECVCVCAMYVFQVCVDTYVSCVYVCVYV